MNRMMKDTSLVRYRIVPELRFTVEGYEWKGAKRDAASEWLPPGGTH